jgi:hypothetical protein
VHVSIASSCGSTISIEGLMTAKRTTPEGGRLDVLVTLIEAWERKHSRFDLPDPVEAIKYHMDQNMIRRLHEGFGIPRRIAHQSQTRAAA